MKQSHQEKLIARYKGTRSTIPAPHVYSGKWYIRPMPGKIADVQTRIRTGAGEEARNMISNMPWLNWEVERAMLEVLT